jgi:DNA-binding response OmpR family regulator
MSTPGAILLVDDEDKILKTLGRALRADGHRVAEAASGQAARQLLAAQDFDLVILDNLMPDVSGLDLIRDGE